MANIKSAKKRIKQNQKRRLRNKSYKSFLRTITKKYLRENDPEKKKDLLKEVYSAYDKAVSKGILHKNTASRKKSKLTKHISLGG